MRGRDKTSLGPELKSTACPSGKHAYILPAILCGGVTMVAVDYRGSHEESHATSQGQGSNSEQEPG